MTSNPLNDLQIANQIIWVSLVRTLDKNELVSAEDIATRLNEIAEEYQGPPGNQVAGILRDLAGCIVTNQPWKPKVIQGGKD
jgi:hypothetical protein